jgi:heptaprenyl diphosphate synthase
MMLGTLSIENQHRAARQKAMWLLAAAALNALELAIPRLPFLPWLKPGFANIITILWIAKFGVTDAMLYTVLRIWVSGFYFGFSLFTLSLSLSGGLLSTAAMSLLWITLGRRGLVGTVGIAVTGALFHNAGQLGVVYLTMSRNMSMFGQIPFMLGASALFGCVTGALTPVIAKIIGYYDNTVGIDIKPKIHASQSTNFSHNTAKNGGIDDISSDYVRPRKATLSQSVGIVDKIAVILTFAVSISIMFVSNSQILVSSAILFSLISLILNPKKPAIFFYPLKFYMLFIFIAITYLFFTYGTRVEWLPFTTNEGLLAFAKQSLRLWCWLQTTHILKRFRFHELFTSALYKIFPNKSDTIEAGMTALERFPEVIRITKSEKKIPATRLLLKPKTALNEYMTEMSRRLERIVDER